MIIRPKDADKISKKQLNQLYIFTCSYFNSIDYKKGTSDCIGIFLKF